MGEKSGNSTWEDYPSTATPVNAARLNAIEQALDFSVESSTVREIWAGTQAELDAITPKDADTLYIVTG